jgi:hypothetical protein
MSLEPAAAAALRLRDALAAEVEEARSERQLLRHLDSAGLFARAARRSQFLAESARLERALAAALARAAGALGLPEVTIARLERAAPAEARQVSAALGEIRALAGALRELDLLNASLAQRALACVRGYVEALAPAPRAYERGGARATSAAVLTVSSRA